jgi:hypothetical protein
MLVSSAHGKKIRIFALLDGFERRIKRALAFHRFGLHFQLMLKRLATAVGVAGEISESEKRRRG